MHGGGHGAVLLRIEVVRRRREYRAVDALDSSHHVVLTLHIPTNLRQLHRSNTIPGFHVSLAYRRPTWVRVREESRGCYVHTLPPRLVANTTDRSYLRTDISNNVSNNIKWLIHVASHWLWRQCAPSSDRQVPSCGSCSG
jgi:hypothetical protein